MVVICVAKFFFYLLSRLYVHDRVLSISYPNNKYSFSSLFNTCEKPIKYRHLNMYLFTNPLASTMRMVKNINY